ncbi:MAG: putative Ig domain-containing protein [Tannerella sp.]|nr:putative Ig domain-containing protein [Tannerella sp.]
MISKFAGAGCALLAAMWLCMALLAPQPLSAQSNSTGNAKQAVGHQLYFGSFPQTYTGRTSNVPVPTVPYVLKTNTRDLDDRSRPYTGYFLVEPVQWRVLANDAEGILLLSEYNLATWAYHTPDGTVTWQASSLRDSLGNRFLLGSTALGSPKNYFSPIEQGAVKPSLLQNLKLGPDADGIPTVDAVFLLSDADSTLFASATGRIAKNTVYTSSYINRSAANAADEWLLRSHSASMFPGLVMFVRQENGHVERMGIENGTPGPIRPALRLSRDRFVMLSNSKPAGINTPGIPLTDGVTDVMKPTLVDPAINLTVNGGADYIPLTTPNLTTLSYGVTSAGANEYISVLVEALGGNVVYYSKLVDLSSAPVSGPLTVTFDGSGSYPPVPAGTYTVKIFREQINASTSEPDLASAPKVFTVGIAASPAPAAITTGNLPDGWTNIFYSDTVKATGDPKPLFSVSAGSLPPGLTLEPTGVLYGTPTVAGTYPFTVTADNGTPDSRSYAVEIRASSAPLITHPAAGLIDSVVRNISVTVDTVKASGGPAPTFSVSSGKLPDGLSLDSVTGIIAGTPVREETTSFTVKAGNPLGNDFRNYQIRVKKANTPVPPAFITTALPPARATLPYSFKIDASGEPAPTFMVESGSLPSGLMLDPVTGIISGTPVATSPNIPLYTVTIKLNNGSSTTRTFTMVVSHTLHPPHLTLTPPAPATVGTGPFSVTATFGVPVANLQLSDIDGTNGTASNLQPVNPTATVPPRAAVWTFDVTPGPSIANGTVIEAYIKPGAALSAEGAVTYMESDTVRAVFYSDQPTVQFNTSSGQAYVSDPGAFWFDVFPNGTAPNANTVYVNGVPATDANIRNAIEIRRNGALYSDWEASISGTRITVSSVFIQGSYEVVLKPGSLGNNVGKFVPQTAFAFSVQVSNSWIEDCPQIFTLKYDVLPVNRTVSIACSGPAVNYVRALDGGAVTAAVLLPAGDSLVTLSFRTLAVPDQLEGDSVTVTVIDPGPPGRTDVFRVRLYNRPKAENVIFIPPTTHYPGYFKLVKGGSPALRRSFDAGRHWSSAWAPATALELSNAGEEIILREPDGCYSLVIPLDASISGIIERPVLLPATANIVTVPGAGEHKVFSGADFVFRVTMTGPLAIYKPLVTTNRQYVPDSVGTVIERNDDGSFTVRIRAIREPVQVTLAPGELLTGNADVGGTQVWTSGGQLCIASTVSDEVKVYTLTGALLKSVTVAAGQTVRTGLPSGFFVVKPGNGRTFKVSGF